MPLDTTGQFILTGDALPSDAFTTRFEAFERVSEPYEIRVDFYTEDASFVVNDCLRKRACLMVADAGGRVRYFDGQVDRAEFLHHTGVRFYFRLRMRPSLASLAHREDSHIFQEKTIIQVIQSIFEEAGFSDKVEWRTSKSYEPQDFIVQYRESQLNFVSRLFEEYGIFYYFAHTEEGHKMIICDDPASFEPADDAEMAILSLAQGGSKGTESVDFFTRRRTLGTSRAQLVDYDFEKPQTKPEANVPGTEAWEMPYFEYPARFIKSAHGQVLADGRLRSLRRDTDVCEGESRAILLRPGVPFTVEGAAEDDVNGDFVVIELFTTGEQHTDGQSHMCRNRFRGIPKGSPWAPPRSAKRPRIAGVQTAIVTGSSTQEQTIHTEKYGRIKVHLYWDRIGQQDHTSSCWIRANQVMMGGTMILPRVGWEVSVAFLEGDPDRPVVLGRLYNAEKTPPSALPGGKTSGMLKSMSSPGAGGYNLVSFGDSGGGQGFNIHAQKDFNTTIEHDRKEEVVVDEEHHVSVNESCTVGVNETIKVSGDQNIDVGSVLSRNVGGKQEITVKGNDTTNTISNYVEKITGNRAYSVGGRHMTICNGVEYTVTKDFTRKVDSLEITGSIASVGTDIVGDYKSHTGLATVQLVNGNVVESVGKAKSTNYMGAELHLSKASLTSQTKSSVTQMVGGLHYQKLDGDLVIKASMITMLGAIGIFKGGSTDLKLGGGPVTVKASKIAVTGALIVKFGASLKMGSG